MELEKNIGQHTKIAPFLLIHIYIQMYIRLVLIRNHCCSRFYKVQFGIEDTKLVSTLPSGNRTWSIQQSNLQFILILPEQKR